MPAVWQAYLLHDFMALALERSLLKSSGVEPFKASGTF